MLVFIGYYSPEQYEILLKYADDPEALDGKWQDWLVQFIKAKNLVSKVHETEDYHVNVEEMQAYFVKKGLKNVGTNRATYIKEQGRLLHMLQSKASAK